jgi:hypothetical protein
MDGAGAGGAGARALRRTYEHPGRDVDRRRGVGGAGRVRTSPAGRGPSAVRRGRTGRTVLQRDAHRRRGPAESPLGGHAVRSLGKPLRLRRWTRRLRGGRRLSLRPRYGVRAAMHRRHLPPAGPVLHGLRLLFPIPVREHPVRLRLFERAGVPEQPGAAERVHAREVPPGLGLPTGRVLRLQPLHVLRSWRRGRVLLHHAPGPVCRPLAGLHDVHGEVVLVRSGGGVVGLRERVRRGVQRVTRLRSGKVVLPSVRS